MQLEQGVFDEISVITLLKIFVVVPSSLTPFPECVVAR